MGAFVKKPTQQQLDDFKYRSTWECSPVTYNSSYKEDEYFLVVYGEADLICEDVGTVHIGPGDLVLVEKDTKLVWDIKKRIKKYYKCVTTIS